MTMLLAPEIFANADVRLRVWVSTGASFQMLSPDQRVTAAAYSLMAAKVADSAVVSSANLADLSVTTAKLANVAVTEGKIADTAVTSGKIANGAVGSAQLAANAVTSAKIADGAITDADISGSAAIAVSKIAGTAGVEFTGLGSLAGLSTTLTSLGSITLTCPASGYVIVTLSGDAFFAGDATIIDVGVGSSAAAFAGYVRVGRHDGTGQLRYVNSFSVERVFAVSAGNNTFHGLAQKESVFDANSVNLSDLYLTGVFIPLDTRRGKPSV